MNWLLDWIPLWAWVVAGGVGLIFAYQLLGWKGMIAALAAMVTLGAYRKGRQTGGADALKKQHKANEKAVKDYDAIKNKTGGMSDDDLDAANDPWVRKHGGKR